MNLTRELTQRAKEMADEAPGPVVVDGMDVEFMDGQLRKHVYPIGGALNSVWPNSRELALTLLGMPADQDRRCPHCTRLLVAMTPGANGAPGWCQNESCWWNSPMKVKTKRPTAPDDLEEKPIATLG